jgi:hypothetical protein
MDAVPDFILKFRDVLAIIMPTIGVVALWFKCSATDDAHKNDLRTTLKEVAAAMNRLSDATEAQNDAIERARLDALTRYHGGGTIGRRE